MDLVHKLTNHKMFVLIVAQEPSHLMKDYVNCVLLELLQVHQVLLNVQFVLLVTVQPLLLDQPVVLLVLLELILLMV